ncbi:MAG: hypothetical protein AAGC55_20190, partial [Myxococcota bacterium]
LASIDGGPQRVTACIMAHANHEGKSVDIWPRSAAISNDSFATPPPRGPSPVRPDTVREGAFAGNLFYDDDSFDPADGSQLELYAYEDPDGKDASSAGRGRVCARAPAGSDALNACGFKPMASCDTSGYTPEQGFVKCPTGGIDPQVSDNPITVHSE